METNLKTNELSNVRSTLPVLEEMNNLYQQARELEQQCEKLRMMAVRSLRSSQKMKLILLTGTAFFAAVILFGLTCAIFEEVAPIIPKNTASLLIIAPVLVYFLLKSKMNKEQPPISAKEIRLRKQAEDLVAELNAYAEEHKDTLELLPRDYRFLDAAVFFEKALANGRADSIREAINLYEEFSHRRTMENEQREIIAQQNQQNQMLRSIQRTSRATAINTGVSAAVNVFRALDNMM